MILIITCHKSAYWAHLCLWMLGSYVCCLFGLICLSVSLAVHLSRKFRRQTGKNNGHDFKQNQYKFASIFPTKVHVPDTSRLVHPNSNNWACSKASITFDQLVAVARVVLDSRLLLNEYMSHLYIILQVFIRELPLWTTCCQPLHSRTRSRMYLDLWHQYNNITDMGGRGGHLLRTHSKVWCQLGVK